MTTYTISRNSITVSFDDSTAIFTSNNEMKTVLDFLASDFFLYYCTLHPVAGRQYQYTYRMIERMRLLVSVDTQLIVDMLRDLFSIIRHYNYPNFCINFVNEI
nr:MAG TPA: hypothetical protein [Microviridae sp.]